jgi:hypothetical protein
VNLRVGDSRRITARETVTLLGNSHRGVHAMAERGQTSGVVGISHFLARAYLRCVQAARGRPSTCQLHPARTEVEEP